MARDGKLRKGVARVAIAVVIGLLAGLLFELPRGKHALFVALLTVATFLSEVLSTKLSNSAPRVEAVLHYAMVLVVSSVFIPPMGAIVMTIILVISELNRAK